ncbi:MAG: DUF1538 domain-containing protein [Methylococcaceae bacterium]|jgi:hypothetical protein
MIAWVLQFLLSLLTVCRDVLPIVLLIIGFQIFVIRRPLAHPKKILTGFVFVLIGITFFLYGLEKVLFPLGKLMAAQLTSYDFLELAPKQTASWENYTWVYVFAACIGFASTLAEPSLLAVAIKAEHISGGTIGAWGLRLAVSVGVAFGLALGSFRIISGTGIYLYILAGYVIVIIQTAFAPKMIRALAYDSGGITTSTVTVPLVTALGLGLASHVPGRNAALDGFGLIAFASLFPTIAVLGYAQIAQWLSKISSPR